MPASLSTVSRCAEITCAIASIASCVLSAAVTSASNSGLASPTMPRLSAILVSSLASASGSVSSISRAAASSAISSRSVVPIALVAIASPVLSASVIASAEPPNALIEAASIWLRSTPLRMERFKLAGNVGDSGIDFPDDGVARRALFAESRGDPIDDFLDRGNPDGERFGAVAAGPVERGLVGAEHRQQRIALRRNPLACFVDRMSGTIEQAVDCCRHRVGDLLHTGAGGFAA